MTYHADAEAVVESRALHAGVDCLESLAGARTPSAAMASDTLMAVLDDPFTDASLRAYIGAPPAPPADHPDAFVASPPSDPDL
jgi:hypothetical protein